MSTGGSHENLPIIARLLRGLLRQDDDLFIFSITPLVVVAAP